MPPLWIPSSGPGWVYVLTSPALPGVVKIGETRRTASVRASEVSRSYGVAAPFVVASKHFVQDRKAIEWMAHRQLWRCRYPASELFQCDPGTAAEAIKAAARSYRPLPPWWVRLRRPFMPRPGQRRSLYRTRQRRGTNWLPVLLLVSAVVALVAREKPAAPSWLPPPIARTVELVERL